MEVVRKGCPVSNSTAVVGKLVLTLVPTNGSTMYPVKYRRGEHVNIPPEFHAQCLGRWHFLMPFRG